MTTVAVLSMKGGVGKSTVVLGLASAAWDRGLRTLVIDLDPQANASMALDITDPTSDTAITNPPKGKGTPSLRSSC